jgi:hypothetical protein
MNKRALEILNRTLRDKIPFIKGVNFKETNNRVHKNFITAYVDIDLNELGLSFPDEELDYDYLESMSNLIEIPYHAFHDFRDTDDSINELVKVLSRSIGVKVNSVRFNIIN